MSDRIVECEVGSTSEGQVIVGEDPGLMTKIALGIVFGPPALAAVVCLLMGSIGAVRYVAEKVFG